MEAEGRRLDVLTIGEMVVDFSSAEKTDTLSNASTFALSREPCRSAVIRTFRKAREMGKIVSLDPNYSRRVWPDYKEARRVIREAYRYVNVTKPSADDARLVFGPDYEPEEYIRMFHDPGAETVVFTMGEEGILISEKGRITDEVASLKLKVEGHVERMIDCENIYAGLQDAGQRAR